MSNRNRWNLTRRRFLGLSLAIPFARSLGGCGGGSSAPRDEHILILGAGMAGLAAGRSLVDRGFQVTIVEGRDRVGGRIWTDRTLGAPVELGANWIEGVSGNPISELAGRHGVSTVPSDFDSVRLYDADGTPVSDAELEQIGTEIEALLEEALGLESSLTQDISVAEAIERVLDGTPLTPEEQRALDWGLASLVVASGEELERLSLFASNDDQEFGGGSHMLPGGYDQIPGALADGLDVRLGHRVLRVSHDATGVAVETDRGELVGDRAIVTFPLGVLQSGAIEFAPALPARKQDAIRRLGFGVLNKVVLRFPSVFWPDDRDFLAYASQARGEFPEFLNLRRHGAEPILVAYTGGDFARAFDTMSDAAVADAATSVLRRIYGTSVPDAGGVVVTRWGDDPFAFGSYSHVRVGGPYSDHAVLAEPVEDRLFFAGEATESSYPGTVHGAYLSGLREAQRIADL